MPVSTTARAPTAGERAAIAQRVERQRRGALATLRSHRDGGLRLGVMFGLGAGVLGVLLVRWPSVPLGYGLAMALAFAVMAGFGHRRNRRLVDQEARRLEAAEAERAREVTELRFAAGRILVVSGDTGDGESWWLFRADDGGWLFFERGQWEELDPSARAWRRDVRLALDGHQTIVSMASDGPPVPVERRDLQPPDYLPTPDTLFWSPPEDQDPRSFVLAAEPTPQTRPLG
ncbi:MAG TPA: hypothetical protein VKZ18_12015 [Polyangia bacterium]|nr:hypothetical protein [Polyangia bacterium]